jgi:hypothetical protein
MRREYGLDKRICCICRSLPFDTPELAKLLGIIPKTRPKNIPPGTKFMSIDEMMTTLDQDGDGLILLAILALSPHLLMPFPPPLISLSLSYALKKHPVILSAGFIDEEEWLENLSKCAVSHIRPAPPPSPVPCPTTFISALPLLLSPFPALPQRQFVSLSLSVASLWLMFSLPGAGGSVGRKHRRRGRVCSIHASSHVIVFGMSC